MDVFDLVAKISVDQTEYDKGLNEASEKTQSAGSKIANGLKTAAKVGTAAFAAVTTAGAAFGKALFNNANEVAGYGDNIDKMSQKMGISAQAYQEWDAILQHSGTSIDSMSRGMITLQKNAVDNADKFEKLGITQEKIAQMSTEELFSATISGLQQMGEGAERTALANKLLGGSAKELGALLNTSAEDTEKMRQKVHELGGVMSDEAVKASANFKDNLQDLQTAIGGVKRGLMSDFLPSISALMDGFTQLISGGEGAEEALDKGIAQLQKAIENAVPKIIDTITTLAPRLLKAVSTVLTSVIKSVVRALPKLLKEILPVVLNTVIEISTMLARELPTIITELFATILDFVANNTADIVMAGLEIVEALIDGIMDNLPKIVDAIALAVTTLVQKLAERLPEFIEKGGEIILSLVNGIVNNLPKIISSVVEMVKTFIKTITENLPQILQAGVKILLEIGKGLFQALPELLKQIPQIITDLISALLSPETISDLLGAGLDIITNIFDGLFDGDFLGTAWDIITGLLEAILAIPAAIADIGVKIVGMIWDGMKKAWVSVQNWFEERFEDIFGNIEKAQKELDHQHELAAQYKDQIEANSRKYHPEWYGGGSNKDEAIKSSNSYADIQRSKTEQQNRDTTRTSSGGSTYINVNVGNKTIERVVADAETGKNKGNGGR